MDYLKRIGIDELISSPIRENLEQIMEKFHAVQEKMYKTAVDGGHKGLEALMCGSVIQVFLIDAMAAGKSARDFTDEDWSGIAQKLTQYVTLEDGQRNSDFIFTVYANFIDVSAENLRVRSVIGDERCEEIKQLATSIIYNGNQLRGGVITETEYIEGCLWLSLEAMIKLTAAYLTPLIGSEFSYLAQAAGQLAFEYGRYVLFSKEQAILAEYLAKQQILDDELRRKFDDYMREVDENARRFQGLIDKAFSPDLHNALLQSAELAREAGAKEEDLLVSIEDVDAFFMN